MPKPKPAQIDKEVKKQDEEIYGDTTIGGHQTDLEEDDDSEEALENVLGNEPAGTIGEEINKDEKARIGKTGPQKKK